MSFNEFKQAIVIGLTFDKPNVQSTITKVDSDGFHYSIGQNGNSKKVAYAVLEKSFEELQATNEFSRAWFKEAFPVVAKEAPCSFTTIGGLFQHFDLATYEKAAYKN
ncbi:hypothetical protein ACIP9G_13195 [Lysinibacillus sp. NPDC093197]|uniref:hypothetical protein n=1 Tax=Lysinibacillus sp. NPDC093197 TaxID=3364132 RepID=UPI0037F65820